MPAKAVKAETPPEVLTDRNEGWGLLGRIYGYPEFKDNGEWPATVEVERETEPPETSDPRDTGWWRVRDQRIAEVNDYQGEPYIIETVN